MRPCGVCLRHSLRLAWPACWLLSGVPVPAGSKSLGWGIRPLKRTTVPKSVITVAAQSVLDGSKAGYTESWRCAVGHYWNERKDRTPKDFYRPYANPLTLWNDVTDHCGYEGLTFLWVYDLAWTARITDMFTLLTGLGWDLDAFSLNPAASWMVWRKGRSVLKVADAASLWPGSLDLVARLFGTARLAEPPLDGPHLCWVARARRDCEILEQATTDYQAWILAQDLGPMAVTGNGQAFKAFRRRFYTHGILVHQDKEARAAERRAMWAGRCEAYWHGTIGFAVVHEWDLTTAYTNIVAEHDVPTFLHGPLDPAKPLLSYLEDDRFYVLAEVDVETTDPVVPAAHGGGIVWPVGRFGTTLWEPELRALLDGGHIVHLRRGWLYRRSPALKAWAGWVGSALDSEDTDVPAWQKAIVKRWGNILIGRFAMRYPDWKRVGMTDRPSISYTSVLDNDTGEEYAVMQMGTAVWQEVGMRDAHDCAPAITGWVMSQLRADLWQLMQRVSREALLYVDTDSLLVTDRWLPELMALQSTHVGRGLRLKRAWDGFSIYGPRQLVTGTEVRVAGLPKRAVRTGRHEWEGETTEGLVEALGAGHAAVVHLARRAWSVTGTDTRRVGPATGWTRPFRLNRWEPPDPPGETG